MIPTFDSGKKQYVAGFLMSFDLDKYLLIDKAKKPTAEQENGVVTSLRWCGIGGQIELQGYENATKWETPHEAMEREFREETGYEKVKWHRWHCFMIKEYTHAKIFMFVAFCSPDEMIKIKNQFPNGIGPEGEIQIHNVIDIFFDPELYTFDVPYLMNMIVRESRRGFITKLDPESVNTIARRPKQD